MRKKTTDEFIISAKKIHGNKYDYSLVEYINAKIKIKISCKKHGIFEQTPNNHLRSDGCPLCKKNKKVTLSEFIKRSKETHGNKYDYSQVVYINTKTKVKIICPEHGEFEQQPEKHMKKNACPFCGGSNKKTLKIFTEISNIKHNNKYDYTNTVYKNNSTKVEIICPYHGVFVQNPSNHMKGSGCEKCSKEKQERERENNIYSYSYIFIQKANIKFKNMFKYYIDTYTNYNTNMLMSCQVHGLFEQRPDNHINSEYGCPFCADKERRLKAIERIEKNKLNGHQLVPNYNPNACEIFDKLSEEKDIHIQHAQNGGEYHLKNLGYWVDGYDEVNNTVYEFDEKYHESEKQQKKDLIRQNEIINHLECEFIRIKEK